MQYENFNQKYHILRKDKNPNSLFSSFSVFKTLRTGAVAKIDERPPYPILVDDPTVREVLNNINKSDVLVGLTFVSAGFLAAIIGTRPFLKLEQKFYVTKWTMWWYTFLGMLVGSSCSYYRLTGFMENGLRWKHKDLLYSKYDFTSDFERKTIFKHLRERVD